MDLGDYRKRFRDALRARYGETFDEGFNDIRARYMEVKTGKRDLDVNDVMAIFETKLPYYHDWTKPDSEDLARRMEKEKLASQIRSLSGTGYKLELIRGIWRCLRELSLTALVLHHVYPERFAMCSHHLASLLYISAPKVPEFYIKYCEELKAWSEGEWPRRSNPVVERERLRSHLTVVDVEFALWTWYRLAYIDGTDREQRQHGNNFYLDPWVQDRRAQRIPESLGQVGRLGLARSYLYTEPTVTAIIAWRELETAMRKTLLDLGKTTTDKDDFEALLGILPDSAFPRNLRKYDLRDLWRRRNPVMHKGEEIAEEATARRMEAARVLNGVVEFMGKNNADFHQ